LPPASRTSPARPPATSRSITEEQRAWLAERGLGLVPVQDATRFSWAVTVQARSALRLDVTLSQGSRLPGTPGRLRATLTDSGIPLAASAALHAVVTARGAPDARGLGPRR
jgi:hypothetical protein